MRTDNSFQSTASEYDGGAGLYYYRARYYDPTTARFINEDPVMWAGGNNFYRYAANNPPLFRDQTGFWPTKGPNKTHQNAIDRALAFLPAKDRAVLKQQQLEMDKDQSVAGSYKHCMRAPDQCIAGAQSQANNWIRSEIEKARAAQFAGQSSGNAAAFGKRHPYAAGLHVTISHWLPSMGGRQFWALDQRC